MELLSREEMLSISGGAVYTATCEICRRSWSSTYDSSSSWDRDMTKIVIESQKSRHIHEVHLSNL